MLGTLANKDSQMNITAFIPARRNSKGIPFKNRQEIDGKSLVEHAVNFAEACNFDEILISTDDEYFFDQSSTSKYCHIRSNDLAQDDTIISDVILQFSKLDHRKNDFFVIIEPTCFIRKPDHLNFLFKGNFFEQGFTTFASFIKSPTVREKIWDYDEETKRMSSGPEVWGRRQEYTPQCVLSGHYYGLYVSKAQEIYPGLCDNNVYPVLINDLSIDINTQEDLDLARILLRDKL